MRHFAVLLFILFPCVSGSVFAEESKKSEKDSSPGYALSYGFKKDEIYRWNVVQQLRVKTMINPKTEVVDTISRSTKVWKVIEVKEDGSAVLEHLVEDVDMHRKQTDYPDSSFNSETDTFVPAGYEQVAASLNVPLARLTVSKSGKILKKQPLVPYTPGGLDSKILIPLPERELKIGEIWKVPEEVQLPLPNGTVKKVKLQKIYHLESVKNVLARIKFKTERLSPIDDPKLEIRLLDKLPSGYIDLDLETGEILAQQTDVKESVMGFEGEMSRIDHSTRFIEVLKKNYPLTEKDQGIAQGKP